MKEFKKDFLAFASASHALTPVYNINGMIDHFTFDYYIDYRDKNAVADRVRKLPDVNIDTIIELMDHIQDNLIDCDYHYISDLLTDFLIEYPQYKDKIDYHDLIDSFEIYGNISEYEDLIYNTFINVNILLNTHVDQNLDYSNSNSNAIISALRSENYSDYEDLIHESSILTLLNSQNVTERMFYNYILNGSEKSNKFMDSLYNELLNGWTNEAVTFFTKMTVTDYLKLKDCKAFKMPKTIECGLVGFLNGSGSILSIELQSDITLTPDQVVFEIDGSINYGIMDIYGLVDYEQVDINIINEGNVQ